jgi:hypothetical protein
MSFPGPVIPLEPKLGSTGTMLVKGVKPVYPLPTAGEVDFK